MKKIISAKYIIGLLFMIKMFIYYYLIDAGLMMIIHMLISTGVFYMIFYKLKKSKLTKKNGIFLSMQILISLLMFADAMYFNYYNETTSIRQLWQLKKVAAVPQSFVSTLIPISFLLFVDIPLIYRCFKQEDHYDTENKLKDTRYILWKKYGSFSTIMLLALVTINPLSVPNFERINKVEFFTGHINDIYEVGLSNIKRTNISPEKVIEIAEAHQIVNNKSKHMSIGEGKNLIVIQLEAFQSFYINEIYNGQEITPNINKLLKEDSLYYDRYFLNVGKGNTADAEFSSFNSLYPVVEGESYRIYEDNDYYGLPHLLSDKGYSTMAFHGYKGEFWNRIEAYPKQGIKKFYSQEDLDQDEVIGMGISDRSLFEQSVNIMSKEEGPFFSFIVTLTNHHPFGLEDKFATINLKEEDEDTKFGDYLETVRYTDEAIGQLIEDLKRENLYDNTVIALYGDHHGLNSDMEEVSEQMEELLGRPYDYDEMFRVPLIVHVPNSGVKETISTTGGHVDFLPTMANIMGLPDDKTLMMGQDITNAEDGLLVFTTYIREHSFVYNDIIFEVSRGGIFEGSRAWKIGTEIEVDIEDYRHEYEKAVLIKELSKEILEQNLIIKE